MYGGKTRLLFFVHRFKQVEERIWEGRMKSSLEKMHCFLCLRDSEILWILLCPETIYFSFNCFSQCQFYIKHALK